MSALLAMVKASPITTITGWVGAACVWLQQRPELAGHPTAQQYLQVAGAACAAVFAAFVADSKAK